MTPLPAEFKEVFQYRFANARVTAEKVLNEELWKQRGVVYARVCDGQVVYVGSCNGTLGARIRAHLRLFPLLPGAKEFAYRNRVEGKTVTIYAYKPTPIRLFNMEIPVHGSVEAALIKRFKRADGWFVKRGA
jgi:hypothetical protein